MQNKEYYPIEALHWAGMNDNCIDDLKDILTKYPEYAKAVNNVNDNCLTIATRVGNIEIVKYLITQTETNLNHISNDGTAIMVAINSDQKEITKYLLTQKLDFDLTNKKGESILHVITRKGKDAIFEEMIKKEEIKKIINKKNKNNQNCLFSFLEGYLNHKNFFLLDLILENLSNEEIKEKDIKGNNPIGYINHILSYKNFINENIKKVKDIEYNRNKEINDLWEHSYVNLPKLNDPFIQYYDFEKIYEPVRHMLISRLN